MRIGRDSVYACPNCDGLVRRRVLLSGNTFGANLWSDGNLAAPMLPKDFSCPITRCRACGHLFLYTDELIREESTLPISFELIKQAAPPGVELFESAVAEQIWKTPDQERLLRVMLWWYANDS